MEKIFTSVYKPDFNLKEKVEEDPIAVFANIMS